MFSLHSKHHFKSIEALLRTNDHRYIYFIISGNIIALIIGAFEVALIYRLTQSINILIITYIFLFSCLCLGFVAAPVIFKKTNLNRIFRISLLVKAALSFLLIIFYPRLDNPVILFALFSLKGLGEGLYWFANNLTAITTIKDEKRDEFFLSIKSIEVLLPIMIPLVIGSMITFLNFSFLPQNAYLPEGYIIVFFLGLLFSSLAYINAPVSKAKIEFHVNFKRLFSFVKKKELKAIRNLDFYSQIHSISIMIAFGLLNFLVLGNELNLGIFASILAFLSSAYFLLLKKVQVHSHIKRESYHLIGTIFDSISKVVYFVLPNIYGLVLNSSIQAFFVPLKGIFSENIINHELETISKEHKISKAELLMFREITMNVSRVLSLVMILLLLNYFILSPIQFCRAVIIIASFAGLYDFILIRRINKNKLQK